MSNNATVPRACSAVLPPLRESKNEVVASWKYAERMVVGQPGGPYEDHSLHPNHWTDLLMQKHAQSQQIKSAKENIETSKLRTPKQCLILYACVSCSKFYQHTNSLDYVHAVVFSEHVRTHTYPFFLASLAFRGLLGLSPLPLSLFFSFLLLSCLLFLATHLLQFFRGRT